MLSTGNAIALLCLSLPNRLINLNITWSGIARNFEDVIVQELLHSLFPFLSISLIPRQLRTLVNCISGFNHIVEATLV
jgi:hypothetical protein